MDIVVRIMINNHLYQFNGNIYKQETGGPIGLDITGVIGRIVMIWWSQAYQAKLHSLGIKLFLFKFYVDEKLVVAEEEIVADSNMPADAFGCICYVALLMSCFELILLVSLGNRT